MKVLISDQTAPICAEILRGGNIEVVENPEITPEELLAEIGEYEGLVVRSRTKVTAEVIAKADKLKVIGRAGAGVDNIDTEAAKERGIFVMNTPGGNTNAVAELAIGYMFSLARHIPNTTASMREGKWEKKKFGGTEVLGKTLGLLGYGKIGRQVALKAIGVGMKVICYDPVLEIGKINEEGVKITTFDEVIESADYLSLHMPKLPSTIDLINSDVLSRMKNNAYLINCARGGIVNEDDLYNALKEGAIQGAALDVYAEEPLQESKLFTLPNVIGSPHIGASTKEAQLNVARAIAEQISEYLNGGEARNVVNR
jgi:D-3-phosphoglycerate dehydrogenase